MAKEPGDVPLAEALGWPQEQQGDVRVTVRKSPRSGVGRRKTLVALDIACLLVGKWGGGRGVGISKG